MYKRYAYSVMRMKYNVHDMMRNESYIRTQLISIACTMFLQKLRGHFFLAVGIFSGLFLFHHKGLLHHSGVLIENLGYLYNDSLENLRHLLGNLGKLEETFTM